MHTFFLEMLKYRAMAQFTPLLFFPLTISIFIGLHFSNFQSTFFGEFLRPHRINIFNTFYIKDVGEYYLYALNLISTIL